MLDWLGYNAQNQVVSTNAPNVTPYTPGYDGAGDVIADANNRYLYDAEGRLCAATTLSGAVGYLYDAAGDRVAKGTITTMSCDVTTNGFVQTAGYVVGPGGEQLTEVDANNNWRHTNVYADGKLIGTYDAQSLHYYFDDPLGTRRAQANSSGVLEAVYVSLPFGDGYAMAGSDDPTENHYTGKERDVESGNDYFLARYYNSASGRFLSPDWSASDDPVPYAKLDNPQTLNLYAYVRNNPLVEIDTDGHSLESDVIESTFNALGLDSLGNYSETVGDTVDNMMAAAEGPFTAALDAAAAAQKALSRSKRAKEIAQSEPEYKAWEKTENLANQSYQRDPTSSHGYMELMVSQLAQANESYLIVESGLKINNLFNGIPILEDLELAALPAIKQSMVGPAENNYRDALHEWQADIARQSSGVESVNSQ